MLLIRSILLKVCLVVSLVNSQEYENEEENVNGSDEDGRPDYSKYYSVDSSPPKAVAASKPSGFISSEFASHFDEPGSVFGASNKLEDQKSINQFGVPTHHIAGFVDLRPEFPEFYSSNHFPRDYYEEAQAKQKQEEEGAEENDDEGALSSNTGPNYISQGIPANYDEDHDSSEVETIPKNIPKSHKAEKEHPYFIEPESRPYYEKSTNYDVGKSSSSVSQYPEAAGYYQPLATTLTPYQKYSFQPVTDSSNYQSKYLADLISTQAPFNPAYKKYTSTEPNLEGDQTREVQSQYGSKCKKITKPETANSEQINCLICQDPETNSKVTKCSYQAEPKPKNLYQGTSERYSVPSVSPSGFRYKRFSPGHYEDPYEYIKAQSRNSYDKHQEEFNADPDYHETEEERNPEKSFSEKQSDEIMSHPDKCTKIKKSGMTCTVCKDPESGGNFEQCSYTLAEEPKKYAFSSEKNYDSLSDPQKEEDDGEESKPIVSKIKGGNNDAEDRNEKQPDILEFGRKTASKTDDSDGKFDFQEYVRPVEKKTNSRNSRRKEESRDKLDDDDYPKFRRNYESRKPSQRPAETQNFEQVSKDDHSEAEDRSYDISPYKDIEEYHLKYFPEVENDESKLAEIKSTYPKKIGTGDVENVLAEFKKKDRSSCKKSEKKGMTCYLCVDKKGTKHEECMYESGSNPKASHVSYQETKETPAFEVYPSSTNIKNTTVTTASPKFKKPGRKVKQYSSINLEPSASEYIEHKTVPKKKKRNQKKSTQQKKKRYDPKTSATSVDSARKHDENEPQIKTPVEFLGPEDGGAYSDETKPVYSKLHGVTLPRYMVEKSPIEREFESSSRY